MLNKSIALLCILIMFALPMFAQEDGDDLMALLAEEEEETTDYTIATFKTTRVINGHSVETVNHGVLMFIIGHRFGRLNSGIREFFGIDNATIRLGFEYGITDNLSIGYGRSSFEKTYDGFAKYKILRQSTGKKRMPITMTALATAAIKSARFSEPDRENYATSRFTYTFGLLIARKFNDYLSLQLSPTLVHRNLVATKDDRNDVFVLGAGGRVKLTGSLAVNLEYSWIVPGQIESKLYGEKVQDAFSVGIDLETGGHVFQLHFTNTRGMIEKSFMTETTGRWLKGDIHFGFNVTRVFTVYDKNKKKAKKESKNL